MYLLPEVLAKQSRVQWMGLFLLRLSLWHLVVSGGQVKGRICCVFLWRLAEFSSSTYESKFYLVMQNYNRKKSSELFKCMRRWLGKPTGRDKF